MSTHSLKVGIDFGTTYSGVAWAHTSEKDEINVIQKWPAGGNKTTDKVPTELKYSPTYQSPGYKWGFGVYDEIEKLVWIKLLLDPSQDSYRDSLLTKTAALMPKDKTPVDLMIDFLTALKAHILSVFESHFGKDYINVTPIEYFLTVPAVWSDSAKALTLHAAEVVGLGKKDRLNLISEPEAAAVYSLKAIQPHKLDVGDIFVVADCGGGTVDLISYEIVALNPKLEVKECVIGTGGMCGSTYINRRFEAWVKCRIGPKKFDEQKLRSYTLMMKHFEEYLKRVFSDETQDVVYCPVPGIEDDRVAGVDAGFLAISRTDMKSIFDPVVNEVIKLVQQQVNSVEASGRKVTSVLLVGGFGASEYLRNRIDTVVCRPKQIRLLQPKDAWTAVARGACMRGLEGISMVKTQLSRRSYGVLCARKHPDQNLAAGKGTFVHHVTGELMIRNRVNWYIKKGDTISQQKSISFPFTYSMQLSDDLVFEDTLLACDLPHQPKNAKNPNVYTVCKLRTNLNVVPRHSLEKRDNPETGKKYYHIPFNLTMRIGAALVFAFEYKGKTYSSVEAEYA